jgi:hypothetical protein
MGLPSGYRRCGVLSVWRVPTYWEFARVRSDIRARRVLELGRTYAQRGFSTLRSTATKSGVTIELSPLLVCICAEQLDRIPEHVQALEQVTESACVCRLDVAPRVT